MNKENGNQEVKYFFLYIVLVDGQNQKKTTKKVDNNRFKVNLKNVSSKQTIGSKNTLKIDLDSKESGNRIKENEELSFRGQNANKITQRIKAEIEQMSKNNEFYGKYLFLILDKTQTINYMYIVFMILVVLESLKYCVDLLS